MLAVPESELHAEFVKRHECTWNGHFIASIKPPLMVIGDSALCP